MILIDQISKNIVRNSMNLYESFPVIGDLFKITYIENCGIAFSMFQESQNKLVLLVIPIIVIISLLVAFARKKDNYRSIFSFSIMMIIAGGLSNLFDRVMFHSVTDFLDLKWFAIFNLADVFAVLGCIFLVISVFFFEKNKENKK